MIIEFFTLSNKNNLPNRNGLGRLLISIIKNLLCSIFFQIDIILLSKPSKLFQKQSRRMKNDNYCI